MLEVLRSWCPSTLRPTSWMSIAGRCHPLDGAPAYTARDDVETVGAAEPARGAVGRVLLLPEGGAGGPAAVARVGRARGTGRRGALDRRACRRLPAPVLAAGLGTPRRHGRPQQCGPVRPHPLGPEG